MTASAACWIGLSIWLAGACIGLGIEAAGKAIARAITSEPTR